MLTLIAFVGFYWVMMFLLFQGYVWFGKMFGFGGEE